MAIQTSQFAGYRATIHSSTRYSEIFDFANFEKRPDAGHLVSAIIERYFDDDDRAAWRNELLQKVKAGEYVVARVRADGSLESMKRIRRPASRRKASER